MVTKMSFVSWDVNGRFMSHVDGRKFDYVKDPSGREILRIPAVFTKVGVHVGKQGAGLKTEDTLKKAAPLFNGMRLVVDKHALIDDPSRVVGYASDVRFDQTEQAVKGFCNYYLDMISPDVRKTLEAGEIRGGSIGYFCHAVPSPGVWQGQKYEVDEQDIVPDHYFAPIADGACKVADGCGLFFNEDDDEIAWRTDADLEKLRKARDARASKYGIGAKQGGNLTPPKGYPSDPAEYGDPVNLKYPLDPGRVMPAWSYYNQKGQQGAGGYNSKEWGIIGKRIIAAMKKHGHEVAAANEPFDENLGENMSQCEKSFAKKLMDAISSAFHTNDPDPTPGTGAGQTTPADQTPAGQGTTAPPAPPTTPTTAPPATPPTTTVPETVSVPKSEWEKLQKDFKAVQDFKTAVEAERAATETTKRTVLIAEIIAKTGDKAEDYKDWTTPHLEHFKSKIAKADKSLLLPTGQGGKAPSGLTVGKWDPAKKAWTTEA
jgi:hypothetical protein